MAPEVFRVSAKLATSIPSNPLSAARSVHTNACTCTSKLRKLNSSFDLLHSPLNPDTDGDGLSDYDETLVHGTE